jgi:hypothetical protein
MGFNSGLKGLKMRPIGFSRNADNKEPWFGPPSRKNEVSKKNINCYHRNSKISEKRNKTNAN